MSDRAVPFVLGGGTCLRFDRGDIKAIENALGIGYPHFADRGIFNSLTATETFIWRGLKHENDKGELVHSLPLNDAGKEQAGELVWRYLQQDNGPATLGSALTDAFFACQLFKRKTPEEKKDDDPGEAAPKN